MADRTFFEVARSQRGIRRYAPDPISDADIQRMIEAATWAPSGSNRQAWHFIVIRDREIKGKLGALYRVSAAAASGKAPAPSESEVPPLFADDLASVPVVIMVCLDRWNMRGRPDLRGSHVFPAVQNLMLAAAALGIGSRLTTIWQNREDEVRALLGIPENSDPMAMIPVGYPGGDEHLGGSRRRPWTEVTHFDRW